MQYQSSPAELPVGHIAGPIEHTSQSPPVPPPRATAELYSHLPTTDTTDSTRYTYYQKPPVLIPEPPSRQAPQPPGSSHYTPSTTPSMNSPAHSQPPAPSYDFVPKSMARPSPQNIYGQAPGNMTMNSTPQTAGSVFTNTNVGPDGLWHSLDGGVQWARDRETLSAGRPEPATYSPSVYEMAS